MSKSKIYLSSTKEEQQFYDDVRHILQAARNSAYKSVNFIMSNFCFKNHFKEFFPGNTDFAD